MMTTNFERNFMGLCCNGFLAEAKLLLQNNITIDISALDDLAFRWSCENGHLKVAKWLLEIKPDISAFDECTFYSVCCNGHLEVAKWLLEMNPNINISVDNYEAFRVACYDRHLELAQWLQSLKPYSYVIYYNDDGSYKDHYIRSKEEELWEQRKYALWLASTNSPNKKSLLYKIPTDISRYLIEKFI